MALVLAFLILVGFCLTGRRLAALSACPLEGGEAVAVGVTLGMVTAAWAMTALAFGGLLYPAAGWGVLAGLYALGWKEIPSLWAETREGFRRLFHPESRARRTWMETAGGLVLMALLFMAVTRAWAPPVRTDALVYHLAVPRAYLDHHGVVNLPDNIYSFFPLLFEMVYLFGLTFEVEGLPALLGVGQAVALGVGLAVYGARYLGIRRAWLAPVLFFSVPTFVEVAASAYVDIALAGFVFFAFYAWDRWRETRRGFWFACLCVFAASAFATKLTAFIVLPLAVLGIAWARRGDASPKRALIELSAFAGTALLWMAPWWARNLHYTGNPFVPLFIQVFGGEHAVNWDPLRAMLMDRYVRLFGMGRSIGDFLLLPWNLTFHSEPHSLRFDGRIGYVHFLLLPAVAGLWKHRNARIGALTLVTAVLIVFWFLYFQYVRFLAPAFTFLSLLLVYGMDRMTDSAATRAGRTGTALWRLLIAAGLLANTALAAQDWLKKNPLAYLAGAESRSEYLSRNLPAYPMYEAMNTRVQPGGKVLFIFMRNLGYLARQDFISDSVFEAHTMQTLLERAESESDILRELQSRGVTHIMFDSNYVWGPDSAFKPEHRARFKRFLQEHARRVHRHKNYYLYRIVIN